MMNYEHLHRYAFCKKFIKNKKVLDLACGEGYGSYILSRDARHVIGIDIDKDTINHASSTYIKENIEFIQGAVLEVPVEGKEVFDVIVCFEAIEHIEDHKGLLKEVKRLLKKDGIFILSTPNKKVYSDEINYKNPFHIKEFYFNEFNTLLKEHFKYLWFFGQNVFSGSNIWPLFTSDDFYSEELVIEKFTGKFKFSSKDIKPSKYFIAIASEKDSLTEEVHTGFHLIDASNAIFRKLKDITIDHLNKQIEQRDEQIKRLSEQLGILENLQREMQLKDLELLKREDKIKELVEKYEEQERHYTEEIAKRDESVYFLKGQRYNLENKLNAILASKTWKIGQFYGKVIGAESPLRRRLRAYLTKKKIEIVVQESLPPESSYAKEDKKIETSIPLSERLYRSNKIYQYDVICLPIIDWFFRYQRPQQILSQFTKNGSRVFYINPKFLNKSDRYFHYKEIKGNIFDVAISASSPLNIYKNNINEENLNTMMISFEALRQEMGIIEAVCIVQLPFWHPLAKKIKEDFGWKIIYDCMDEHSGFSTNKESMLSNEELLVRECDLLITTARPLYEKMKSYNERCILVPNAADFNHFSYLPPNDLLREIKKPIIGYYGAISDWFDNELIEYLATNKKDWSFVFIGHTFGSNISKLEKMPNVYFLGEKPYGELPKYLYWFDICIIPFKVNDLIKATNPVKFYEFMSSGKRVIAVELPELLPYSKYLYLAGDKKDFLQKIETALRENDQNLVSERIALAKDNTWEKRFETLSSEIKEIHAKVSIIIVTYNNLDYTKLCIESIFSKTQYPNYEIIFVDNNSTDGTRDYLQGLATTNSDIKVILNDENLGFARANNQGILAASGEYIVFLNNDTILTRGWVTKFLRHLQDEAIGMVGPVTNSCGNEARIDVPYKTIDELTEFSERYIKEHMEPEGFDIKMLALYCVAMRRNIIDEVGLLDERFQIGMFEDDDYAHRVRLKGYRVACAEDIFIHHFGEASFGELKKSGEYMKLFEENKKRYEEKWGIKWEPHRYREVKT